MKKTIKLDIVCQSCNGTGLYSGMCERDGCAVICYNCNGTGKFKYVFSYEEFKEQKMKRGIKRVFQRTCGFVHGPNDVKTEEGKLIEFSKAGCSYPAWYYEGENPKPVKELYCPYLWTQQSLQSKDVNNLYKNQCKVKLSLGSSITSCEYFKDKEKCWEIFEGVRNG